MDFEKIKSYWLPTYKRYNSTQYKRHYLQTAKQLIILINFMIMLKKHVFLNSCPS